MTVNQQHGRLSSPRLEGLNPAETFPTSAILTIREVAQELRCSKAHVHNLINGRVRGVKALPAIPLGRRRIVRRESLNEWIASNERELA